MARRFPIPAWAVPLATLAAGCGGAPDPPRFTPATASAPGAESRPMPADPGGDARPARNIATH